VIFGIQMYLEEMQVKFDYGCDPIILKELLPLDLENFLKMSFCSFFSLENGFLFIFSLMDGWMDSNVIWYTDLS
jgi:hypothetical protein